MRDSKPGRFIQQQMYARERRGIFRSTEGYDTIAKSNGLDPNFIKKQLHPFCVYDSPAELAARSVKDDSAYPEAMHLLRLENGDMLLGRSVYQGADFTGLRSAFFTHNYIIPGDDPHQSENDYKAWLRASFAESYNIEEGMELPELTTLPVPAIVPSNGGPLSILTKLQIDEKRFKQLLYAVMAAVGGGKKKIYVALNVPIAEMPIQAKQLLSVIYGSLPYAFRKALGFITYAKEPQSRKSVHLTFVEQGSIRVGDRNVEKDFTFDFANNRVTNVDLEGSEHPYLDFAWTHLENTDHSERFYQFAEQMLSGMEPERQMAASSYHELSVMFQIEENNEELYDTHKSAILRGLLDYLGPAGSLDSKIRLNDLFLSRFDREFDHVLQGNVPEAYIADCFKDYYRIDGKHNERKILNFFILAINNAISQNRRDAADSFYATVESNPALSHAFFALLLTDAKRAERLFMPYMEEKLGKAPGVKSFLQLIEKWCNDHPALFANRQFQELASQQLKDKLEREHRSMSAVSKALEGLSKLEGEAGLNLSKGASYGAVSFYEELSLTVYRSLLTELDVDGLTKDQLAGALFLSAKDQLKRWNGELHDPRQRSSALVLSSLYDWFALPKPNETVFEKLSPAEIDRVQGAGRRLLAAQLEPVQFERLVQAFRHSSDVTIIDYAALLEFLSKNAGNKETVYRFFQWTETHPEFMKSRGFVPAYTAAILAYFKKYDRDAFKKRATWKTYFDGAGSNLQAVYKAAQLELSSPMAKFFRRNRKATFLTTITTLGVILIAVGLILTLTKEEPKEGAELPEVTPTNTAITQNPETLVHVVQTAAADGKKATTSLVFLFRDAAACRAFIPGSMTILTPDKVSTDYTDLSYESDCQKVSTESPGGAATDNVQTTPTDNAANKGETSSTPPPVTTTDSNTGKGSGSGSGNEAANKEVVTPTPTPTNSDSPSASATATGNPNSEPTSTPPTEAELYVNQVVIQFGKQVEIPVNSIIEVDGITYKVTEAQDVSAG